MSPVPAGQLCAGHWLPHPAVTSIPSGTRGSGRAQGCFRSRFLMTSDVSPVFISSWGPFLGAHLCTPVLTLSSWVA